MSRDTWPRILLLVEKFGVTSAEDERGGLSPLDRPDARPYFVPTGSNNAPPSSFFQRVCCSGYRPATRSIASYTYLDAAGPRRVHENNRISFERRVSSAGRSSFTRCTKGPPMNARLAIALALGLL